MDEKTYHCLALSLGSRSGHQKDPLAHPSLWVTGQCVPAFVCPTARFRLSEEAKTLISSGCALRVGEESGRQAEKHGIRILSVFDDEYPHQLKEIFDLASGALLSWQPFRTVPSCHCRGGFTPLLSLWKRNNRKDQRSCLHWEYALSVVWLRGIDAHATGEPLRMEERR